MAKIRYPYAVKCDGVFYAPGAVIQVKDAAPHLALGAEEIKSENTTRRRTGTRDKATDTQTEE